MTSSQKKRTRIFLSPPHMSGKEREFVAQAFDSNFIAPVGPQLAAFEAAFRDYTGISHAVAVSSGTAAMHLALRAVGVGPGDVVFASTLTFIGSVSPVRFLGAEPVFIDADRDTWNMDPTLLERALREAADKGTLPRAVLPTDLYGQCADLDAILAVCDPFDVPVIADSAEAMGARYRGRHAGAGAGAAIYSFNGNKIITTSGGGMLASDDEELIARARHWATQAREPVMHYEHQEIGYNYRLSNVLAGIGLGQLQVLDDRVASRRELFDRYREQLGVLPGISFMPEAAYGQSNRWLTVVEIDPPTFGATPEQVRLALEEDNIEARPVWKPMHLQPVFEGSPVRGGAVAEELFRYGLCLPSGSAMTDVDVERVCGIVRRCARCHATEL